MLDFIHYSRNLNNSFLCLQVTVENQYQELMRSVMIAPQHSTAINATEIWGGSVSAQVESASPVYVRENRISKVEVIENLRWMTFSEHIS